MKSHISKEQIANIVSNLSLSLQQLNNPLITPQETNDPILDLQSMHSDMVKYLSSSNEENIPSKNCQSQTSKLENQVLLCLRKFIVVNEELCSLSNLLYEEQYPFSVYKSFRKLYQGINEAANCLYQIQPTERNLEAERQQLINQNLEICSHIVHRLPTNKIKTNQEGKFEDVEEVQSLRRQIAQLNDIIRQNDEQFSIQIQRYNHTLFDLQQTIREYEVRLDKIKQYQAIIDELEHRIIRFKEEKCRDQMLIENMTKKIRLFEKERGGNDIFLSPRNKKFLGSPTSKFRSPNMSAINSFDMKNRNFVGERMTSG